MTFAISRLTNFSPTFSLLSIPKTIISHQTKTVAVNESKYKEITTELAENNAQLCAVSKIKPVSDIEHLYDLGQRDFGENYVQELLDKNEKLPEDTRWHFIGNLQRNKVKYIAPFIHLIHGVDSLKLLKEINKESKKNNRVVHCLLQVFIADEETKFGLDKTELEEIMKLVQEHPEELNFVCIDGLMGMASNSFDMEKVRLEMRGLKQLFDSYKKVETDNCKFTILSMGMSGDYRIAIEEGSNMVRIGSLLFGARW